MNEEQVCKVPRRRSRQEVDRLVAEYESSGLSRLEFCRERGVGLSTLDRYRTRRKGQPQAGGNALLAVVLRGGRRVEVGRGFDAGTLEQLVHVLEGV